MHLLTYILTFWHPTSVSHTIHYGAGLGDRPRYNYITRHSQSQRVMFRSYLSWERRVFFPLYYAPFRVMPRQYARLLCLAYLRTTAASRGVARATSRVVWVRTAERIASPWRAQCEFIATSLHCLDNSSTYNIYSFSPFFVRHHSSPRSFFCYSASYRWRPASQVTLGFGIFKVVFIHLIFQPVTNVHVVPCYKIRINAWLCNIINVKKLPFYTLTTCKTHHWMTHIKQQKLISSHHVPRI